MNDNRLDSVFKTLRNKGNTSSYLEFYEEPYKSGIVVTPENFWSDMRKIPATAPNLGHLEEYSATSITNAVVPILRRYVNVPLAKVVGSSDAFYSELLQDSIPHDYEDGSYHYTLTDNTGKELAFGLNSWSVDAVSGILMFYKGLPAGITYPLLISFYKYIGPKGFDNTLNADGSVPLLDGYTPSLDQDVATKKYVDDVAVEIGKEIDLLKPEAPTPLSDYLMKMYLYEAYRTGTGIKQDCNNEAEPVVYALDKFGDGKSGILEAFCNGVSQGEVYLDSNNNEGSYGNILILANDDPYVEIGKRGMFQFLVGTITPDNLDYMNTVTLVHSETGTSEKIFFSDDPIKSEVINVENQIDLSNGRTISGVPSLSDQSYIKTNYRVIHTVGTFYNHLHSVIESSHCQNVDVTSTHVRTDDEAIDVEQVLNLRPNTYTENFEFSITGLSSDRTPSDTIVNKTGHRIDLTSDETERVDSGEGLYPNDYGSDYMSNEDLHDNEELQLINNTYVYPTMNFAESIPAGPDYSDIDDTYRYVTFAIEDIKYADGIIIQFNEAFGFLADQETHATLGISLHCRFSDTNWIDCNSPYPGVGIPSENGDPALVISGSNAFTKKVTFGPTVRTGLLHIRVGLQKSSMKFRNITVTSK